MLSTLTALLSIPLLVAALPTGLKIEGFNGPLGNFAGCPTANATLTFPEGQTALSVPSGQVPNHILLGTGVQNYTCSSAGTYTSSGAVAKLYDISCLLGTPEFATVQDAWFAQAANSQDAIQGGLNPTTLYISDHYFVPASTGTGISPKFASARDGGVSFTVASKAASIHAPNITDVDWLQLSNIQGDFAKTTFRVDTKAGQPPASCEPGSAPISVPYAAKYWFFA